MTDQETLDFGAKVERLLLGDDLPTLFEFYRSTKAVEMLQARTGDDRERIHAEYRAFEHFEAFLISLRNAKNTVLADVDD